MMKNLRLIIFLLFAQQSFAQNLQQVTDNGNSTSNGIHTANTSNINGVVFETVDTYYKQLKPVGYNLNISNGAGNGKFYLPYSSESGNAWLQNFGLNIDRYLGIATASPQVGIQLGDVNNSVLGKQILIPGAYNFEQLRLGQMGNGNVGLEMVNHTDVNLSYGVKLKADIDQGGAGLQFQYAPATNSYETLGYLTGMFLSAINGNVGIGTSSPQEKLSVNGKVRAKEIKVETANWPDYVFRPGYQKMSLAQIEAFIKVNGHLPEVPSAKEAEKEGIALGEMNKILLKKIEELTLHLLEKDKQVKKVNDKLDALIKALDIADFSREK